MNRQPGGVPNGGQFARQARPEPDLDLPSDAGAAINLTYDVDPVEGNCWMIPPDVDTSVAAESDVPMSVVSWWAKTPGEDSWCQCGSCPSQPHEIPEGREGESDCDGALIAHYAARMEAGDEFPPVQVIHDPQGQDWGGTIHHVLVDDGFHRISAALMLGRDSIPCHVFAVDHTRALSDIETLAHQNSTPGGTS